MPFSVEVNAHAVLLPVIPNLCIDAEVQQLLLRGTRSFLVGETADEYAIGTMSAGASLQSRRRRSMPSAELRARAGGGVIVAVDQELAGIERLHRSCQPSQTGPSCST